MELIGTLTSLKVFDGRWGIGTLQLTQAHSEASGLAAEDDLLSEGASVTIVGNTLAHLSEGSDYRVRGNVKKHPQYGRQFEVEFASVELAPNPQALKRYLIRNLHGVGEVSAGKIIEKYKAEDKLAELRDQLLSNPLAIDVAAITGRKTKIGIKTEADQGIEHFIHRDLSIRLSAGVVNDGTLRRIATWLAGRLPSHTSPDAVPRAWEMFAKDPYLPIMYVGGYGFSQADAIGLAMDISKDHPSRLAALAIHTVTSACDMVGHVYLTRGEYTKALADVDPSADVDDTLNSAIAQAWPIVVDEDAIYLRKYHFAQARVANLLKALAHRELAPIFKGGDLDREISAAEAAMGKNAKGESFKLDPSQREALRGILTSPKAVHTLTAGPGCGKTSIMEIMVGVVGRSSIGMFAAPTGKAAKVLNARLARYGMSSKTIHMMLGVQQEGFIHDEKNPIHADYVVIDESSMIDIELFGHLLAAIPAKTHIIFLGDTNQLPSVGPGQMLADLQRIDFDHHRLNRTHRNDGGILQVVNEAATGVITQMDGFADVQFSHGLPEATEDSVARIMLDYERAVARHGINAVALLTARKKGRADTPGWNTTYLNAQLRARMNPHGQKIRGTGFYLGDRVVARKNMVLVQGKDENDREIVEQVVNGDTGTIQSVTYKKEKDGRETSDVDFVMIALDDGRKVKFPSEALSPLAHAYALTVHMSQGSEYAEVLFVCTNGMPTFIHRGIVFTAMSRAKKMLRIYAEDYAVRSVVRRPIPRRNSMVVELVDMPAQSVPQAVVQTHGASEAPAAGDKPLDLNQVVDLLGW